MEGAAQTLVNTGWQLLAAEYGQLRGVGGDIAELRDDLDTMNALLRMQSEADEGAEDHFVRVWMKQLREVAYDAEDCIDLYRLRIRCRPGDGVRARLRHLLRTLFSRRRLAGEISVLRARAVAIGERHARYGVNRDALRRHSPSSMSATPMLTTYESAHVPGRATADGSEHERNHVVGIDSQVEALAKKLLDGECTLKVLSIVGFGGLGKTTLALEICRRLEAEFPYQAVVSVSQAFEPGRDLRALLKRILQQIVKPKQAEEEKGVTVEGSLGDIDGMDARQLAQKLDETLKDKRLYLLEFLSVKGTNISKRPSQVGRLEHLQTLNTSGTYLTDLPTTMTNLEKLESVEFSHKIKWHRMWVLPLGLSKMQTLRQVHKTLLSRDGVQLAHELGELQQLQSIGMYIQEHVKVEVLNALAQSLSKLYSVRSLDISHDDLCHGDMSFLHDIPTPPRLLQYLRIEGPVLNSGLPKLVGSLRYLMEFRIMRAGLVGDQLFGVLYKLPNLKSICMQRRCYNK